MDVKWTVTATIAALGLLISARREVISWREKRKRVAISWYINPAQRPFVASVKATVTNRGAAWFLVKYCIEVKGTKFEHAIGRTPLELPLQVKDVDQLELS